MTNLCGGIIYVIKSINTRSCCKWRSVYRYNFVYIPCQQITVKPLWLYVFIIINKHTDDDENKLKPPDTFLAVFL